MIRSRRLFFFWVALIGHFAAMMASPGPVMGQTATEQAGKLKVELAFATDRLKSAGADFFSDNRAPTVTFGTAALRRAGAHPNAPFVIDKVEIFDDFAQLEMAQGKRSILVYVHGFATSFSSALQTAATIASSIPYDGKILVYAWPSRGDIGPRSYNYDRESALRSAAFLTKIIEQVLELENVAEVNLIGHSLGNLPLIETLWDLRRQIVSKRQSKLGQIILCSPDLDRDYFEQRAGAIAPLAKGVTLFASGRDRALLISREMAGGKARAGEVPPEGPIVVNGIDTIDATLAGSNLDLNHNAYAQVDALIKDVGQLLASKDHRRPGERSSIYQERQIAAGTYWVYKP